jgi:hypothetical protein
VVGYNEREDKAGDGLRVALDSVSIELITPIEGDMPDGSRMA